MRRRLALCSLLLVPLVAGACGGGGGTTSPTSGTAAESGAAVAPATTELFFALDTDPESSQWKALESLAERFPALESLLSDSEFQDLREVAGPETDILALTFDDAENNMFLGLLQPEDLAKFRQLLDASDSPSVNEEIGGWTVIADEREAIDRFKRARLNGTLAGNSAFRAATENLPAERLVSFFIPGGPIAKALEEQLDSESSPIPGVGRLSWVSGAIEARENGISIELRARGDEVSGAAFTPDLVEQVPAGVFVLVSFKGLDEALEDVKQNPAVQKRLGPDADVISETLDKVVALFESEGVFYVRSAGLGIPEGTLVLQTDDPADAVARVGELLTAAGGQTTPPEDVEVGGVPAKKVAVSGTALYYAGFDGKLVVTSAPSGIEGLTESGTKLPEDPIYSEAIESAGLPEQTAGFVYLNLADLLPLAESLAEAGDNPPSEELKRNLEALRSLVLFASVEGSEILARGFLSIK